uniref:Uncharacterized protein n=1 Tax=Oryza punctata TaxID=4537 RepID=A0A0E0LN10_ORYPU
MSWDLLVVTACTPDHVVVLVRFADARPPGARRNARDRAPRAGGARTGARPGPTPWQADEVNSVWQPGTEGAGNLGSPAGFHARMGAPPDAHRMRIQWAVPVPDDSPMTLSFEALAPASPCAQADDMIFV